MSDPAATEKFLTKIWQVEWSVLLPKPVYYLGPPENVQVRRQFFESPESAESFKKSLVAAAALLGTSVNPVLSEAEVK